MEKNVKRASRKRSQKGFTLIELLIVIGLLGALASLILPSLSADREKALGDVCDYNQAGTLRTLQQYYDMYGIFPNNLHLGLDGDTSGVAIEGLPAAQKINMDATGANYNAPSVLTDAQAESLYNAGITKVAYDYGYNLADAVDATDPDNIEAATTQFVTVTDWTDDGGQAITFNGSNVAAWEAATNRYGKAGRVLCLWITPTADWDNHKTLASSGGNGDWTKGSVDLKISLAGKCPIPVTNIAEDETPDFSYYMAYILAFNDGTKAVLIGTSCPEDGILNP